MRVAVFAVSLALITQSSSAFGQQPSQPYPPQPYPPQPYPAQPYPTPAPYPYPAQPVPYPYPQQPTPYRYPPQPAPYPYPPPPPTAQPTEPKQLVRYEVRGPMWALFGAGLVVFSLTYAIPLIATGANGFPNASEYLAIPLFGPLVTLSERESTGDDDGDVALGLVTTGLLQHIGVAMLSAGLSITQTRTEREYVIAPIVGPDRAGLNATFSF